MNVAGVARVHTRISQIQARIRQIEDAFQPNAPEQPFQKALATEQARDQMQQAPGPSTYDDILIQEALNNRLDPSLLRSVMLAESGGDPNAVSPAGAQGLMQLMPDTAAGLGVSNPFDPGQNIAGGARYLRSMVDMFGGDVARALGAYNAGPGAVERYNGIPPYPETQAYVERVLDLAALPDDAR